jgi:gas vesicle protein
MNWKDIGNMVAQAAPLLGSVLGGPAGGAVGEMVAQALGTDNNPDKIADALKNNPDAMVKLKEFELAQTVELQKLKLQEAAAYIADIQDARKTEIDRVKASGHADVNLYILAWTVVISFFITTGILLFATLPQNQANIVYMLLGTLGTGFATVLGYFFGSSKGSADKTQLLSGGK